MTRSCKILKDWAASHPDTLGDDLSLIPTYGTLSTHLATHGGIFGCPERLPAQPADPSHRAWIPFRAPWTRFPSRRLTVGMKRTVLYRHFPHAVDAIPTLQNLTERAVGQQVRVNVWIVASTDFFSSSGATALKDLAIQTGGQYVLFSGVEPLPGLETYLAPLRPPTSLTYTSGILTSGGHTLTAQTNLDGETVTSAPLVF